MPLELYRDATHVVQQYTDLLPQSDLASSEIGLIQSNQFLLVHDKQGILLDPGGTATYSGLFMGASRFFSPKDLRYLVVSHCAPDSLHSVGRWLIGSQTELLISQHLLPQLPHLCDPDRIVNRIHGIPDSGAVIQCGGVEYLLLSAHFLGHSACFQLYDPISKILFTGPLGCSDIDPGQAIDIHHFPAHQHNLRAWHARHIHSRRVCQLWVNMLENLDIAQIVPQRGPRLQGRDTVAAFFEWLQETPCGTDLVTQDHYRIPKQHGRAAMIGWEKELPRLDDTQSIIRTPS
ncbi:MBL fold metallo-hydrolase [Parvibium lacunae]|nr:MBL fold metallo-hydrolase [Parvibium lacunae]